MKNNNSRLLYSHGGRKSMEMSLVNPMESDREKRRTRVKLTLKEFKDRTTQMLLIYKGFDITKPVKKNSRYIYFEVDGDLLNRR